VDGGAGGFVGSDSGKVRSSESPLAFGSAEFELPFGEDCADVSPCCDPDGADFAPAFCPDGLDCGDRAAEESELLPCCAKAVPTAAMATNTNNFHLIFLFYLRCRVEQTSPKKSRPLRGS
jgi:hypothetical protein